MFPQVVSGKMGNAAHYLRDVEEIINLHGVQKVSRSSKVRMLHSIYLYLRVLTERASTTEYRSQSSTFASSKDLTITSSAQELSKWDRMIGFPSSSPESGTGLDFAPSPAPYKSMFEEIYSVPQSLFKLILQTTHMSAMAKKMQQSGRPLNIDHDAFAAEVKDLESSICTWEYGVQGDSRYSAHSPLPGREIFPYHLVQAVHKALIVYFYRCVRDVNAAILQSHVQQIIHHLSEYDRKKQKYKDQSANTCWPGFIAGCEALDTQLRQQIADWLERSGQSTGIRMFAVALEAVQKVWQARSLPGMQNAPWNEVLAQFSELRVLVLS
jgi:arginine metabolism regulation protein II